MVELGDLREGLMVADVLDAARVVSRTRHLTLAGIATNLACRSGVIPGDDQMQELSALATTIASKFGVPTPNLEAMVVASADSSCIWSSPGITPLRHARLVAMPARVRCLVRETTRAASSTSATMRPSR